MSAMSRRLFLCHFVPVKLRINNVNEGEYLEKNAVIIKNIQNDSFKFQLGLKYDDNAILKMESVEWYDPVTRDTIRKSSSELFIVDSVDV